MIIMVMNNNDNNTSIIPKITQQSTPTKGENYNHANWAVIRDY